MPKVTVSVPHSFPPDEVVERATPYIEKLVEDFQGSDLDLQWHGHTADFSFKSLTFQIKGDVDIQPDKISVSVDLPFAAMMFKDKVEKAIHKNLNRAIGEPQE